MAIRPTALQSGREIDRVIDSPETARSKLGFLSRHVTFFLSPPPASLRGEAHSETKLETQTVGPVRITLSRILFRYLLPMNNCS